MSSGEIVTLSLFSGGGGLDLGFSSVGFSIYCCVDNDPYSCKTLEINKSKKKYFKNHAVLERDIVGLSGSEIIESVGLSKGVVDMIVGGPPCQAFSVFGRRGGLADPRSNLVWEYLRIIKEIKPKAFMLENVPGLRTIHNGELYNNLLSALSCDSEYSVSDHHYELADFGVPQRRTRIFFIGQRNGVKLPLLYPTHGSKADLSGKRPHVTVGQILEGMPEPSSSGDLPNHVGRRHSERIIERYKTLQFGERDPVTRINKLDPNRPSYTIIVGSDAGGGKGHIHPYLPREVTPRESARIQTFPDWWEFFGTGRHVIRQVGNAVPPVFAAIIGEHLARHIFGRSPKYNFDKIIQQLDTSFIGQ